MELARRRAPSRGSAVSEGGGGVKAPPTACIARGPDGTKGFVLRRTKRDDGEVLHREKAREGEEDLRGFLRPDLAEGEEDLRGFLRPGLVGASLVALFAVSFPWLGAAALVFFLLDSIGHLKPEATHSVAAVLELAGGLVLGLWVADWGLVTLFAASRLVCVGCVGGVLPACAIFLAIVAGEYLSRRLHRVEVTPVLGVEEEEDEEEKEEQTDVSSGTRACPTGAKAVPSSAAAAEAGRLRRRASARLQYKVFDPGRGR